MVSKSSGAELATPRLFLLSPASCGGERARLVFDARARFELARNLRSPAGVALGEIFSFLSGLYFRGKLRYASAFARPPADLPGVLVITAGDGLRPPAARVTLNDLERWAGVSVDPRDALYARPLERDARRLARRIGAHSACEVVLLGSVASAKYVDLLLPVLGSRLLFPADFVGRGDMSRGGLLLRAVDAGQELSYVRVEGTVRRGPRPPRLVPR